MTGKLIKKDTIWWVENEKLYPNSVKLYPETDDVNLNEGDVIEFEYVKTFLYNETLWWAKILPKQETWDDIIILSVKEGNYYLEDLIAFLKENYFPPKKK